MTEVSASDITIAIAGNPNSGKTTLFNRLTGLKQKVANYPGITIEKKTGVCQLQGKAIQFIDLPGTYSLNPISEEEKIASAVITGTSPSGEKITGVFCLADSACLERSLGLALQIKKSNVPMALLLNMADELKIYGLEIDTRKLSQLLGIPVISLSALTGQGMEQVRRLAQEWADAPPPQSVQTYVADISAEETNQRRGQAKEISRMVIKKSEAARTPTDKIDRFVMHRVWGPLIFAGVVLAVFQAIFTIPQPFMDLIDVGFSRLGAWVKTTVPHDVTASFIADGVITGTGAVVVFLPQILVLFFFLALLEYSGYMARAAMVMDRFMSKLGLQGKSFLPLISSCACAIPGIMASRIIENRRDRLATIFIAPFMPCSARLPVYALLIGAFIPNTPLIKGMIGLRSATLLGLYLAGFIAAFLTAWALKSTIFKSDLTPFILEIPPYRKPPMLTILVLMWERSKIFLRRAGGIILLVSIILWVLLSFPKGQGPEPIKESFGGRIGTAVEPLIKPLGFDWKIGVGLLASQAAREMIISSLSTTYRIEEGTEAEDNLQTALKRDLTPLQAVSLLIFFVFAMQCVSTLAVVRRETGNWKIPVAMFIYMNALAYAGSLLVYQGGKLLGF